MRTAPVVKAPGAEVLLMLYGSHAHGTETLASDEDWRGVFMLPNNDFLGLGRPTQTWEDKANDAVMWELGQFCRLLLKGNPNIVGMLFAPDEFIVRREAVVNDLFDNRERFLTTATADAYMGWAKRELYDIGKLHKGHAKRLSHVPRLLWELEAILRARRIDVRPLPPRLKVIRDIKTGEMPYDEAVVLTGELLLDIEQLYEMARKHLPEPPTAWMNEWLLAARRDWG